MLNKKTILEGNKLIATFLGYTYYPFNSPALHDVTFRLRHTPGWKSSPDASEFSKFNSRGQRYLCRSHNHLSYHLKWDGWMMKALDKIEELGYQTSIASGYLRKKLEFSFQVHKDYNLIIDADFTYESRIECVFSGVVAFIKMYNNGTMATI